MNRFAVIILLLLFIRHPAKPQSDSTSGASHLVLEDVSRTWSDAKTVFSSPFQNCREQLLTTGVILGATALLFTVDTRVRDMFQRSRSQGFDRLAEFGTEYGRPYYGLGTAGALYVGGIAFANQDVRETGVMLFESIAFAGVTTSVLKVIIGRSRPYVGEGNTRFRGFQFDDDYLSLPSGHATVAFSVSSLLSERIKNPLASGILYSAATVTALSRIYNDEHWLSDVFLGSAIGIASGMAVTRLHEREPSASGGFYIVPSPSGVLLGYSF